VQLCLDSTKAFLASTTCAEQLDVSTFEQKNVYTIEGPSEMLSNTDKSLVEVNAIFECYRIKNDQRTRIQFIEMNETREDGSIYYWLQLDNICVSVFFAVKGGKLLHYTHRVAQHWSSTNLAVRLLLLSVETKHFTKEMITLT